MRILVHAITQEDVGTHRVQVDYPAVGRCFEAIGTLARQTGLDVHFPWIGCGLAGGSWDRVAPLIEEGLAGVPAHLWTLSP